MQLLSQSSSFPCKRRSKGLQWQKLPNIFQHKLKGKFSTLTKGKEKGIDQRDCENIISQSLMPFLCRVEKRYKPA
jgi:hypothetical protein